MARNSGLVNQRDYPRLVVLSGYRANEPQHLRAAYPVGVDGNGDEYVILSGQIITPYDDSGTIKWQLGFGSGDHTDIADCYVALNDSTDEDVIEAGTLVGLSCAGMFEFQTGFFKASDPAFAVGDVLFADDNGDVALEADAPAGAPRIGQVTRRAGPFDISAENSNVAKDANGEVLVISWRASQTGAVGTGA